MDDVSSAIFKAAYADKCVSGNAYNVCSGVEMRLDELFDKIRRALTAKGIQNLPSQPEFKSSRPGEILNSLGDRHRSAEALGLSPPVDFTVGLQQLLEKEHGI